MFCGPGRFSVNDCRRIPVYKAELSQFRFFLRIKEYEQQAPLKSQREMEEFTLGDSTAIPRQTEILKERGN